MTARYLSLWMPRFTCDWLDRHQPGMRLRPVVITTQEKGGLVITGCNLLAARIGVQIGMKLADARALEPQLVAIDDDPIRDHRALEALTEWCERFTPFAALNPPGGVFLDITGCAHLFGGEQALLHRLLGSLQQIGYESYAAIADTPGSAWAMARYVANPDRAGIVVPAARQTEALAALQVASLRISSQNETALQRLGLRQIGDLYPMKRAALAKRFGAELLLRYDQALGNVAEPISPRQPAVAHTAKELFVEPITTRDAIEASTYRLLETLCHTLHEAGRGARQIELRWWRVDGITDRLEVGTSAPSRAAKHLMRLFAERFDHINPGFGIEGIALSAIRTDVIIATQSDLERQQGTADLASFVDCITNRLGPNAVTRFAPAESWLPEHAVSKVSPVAKSLPAPKINQPPRPLRLLSRPQRVEVVAMLPDEPPVLMRWKGSPHRIVRAEGPERIEPEWWKRGEPSRDYYRVEDQDGRRYWVYRAGTYNADHPPRWYLHGLFA